MFGFKKQKQDQDTHPSDTDSRSSLEQGLERTRKGLFGGLRDLFSAKKSIDLAILEDVEDTLLLADLGIEATSQIIKVLEDKIKDKQITNEQDLFETLKQLLIELLGPVYAPLTITKDTNKPFLIMVVGVNGAGKTTTIGKLAKYLLAEDYSLMLAAGDTFRAAAIEQLQAWGEHNQVPVIAQASGADSAAVIYDALESARAREIDVCIADTAGRLHTKTNLMEELKKVYRVTQKFDPDLKLEILLVLDATTGQNALIQARQFHQAVGVTGIALTKLDGTAKGGIIFALAKELGLPIRYIGIGEKAEDLRVFEPEAFVSALLADQK